MKINKMPDKETLEEYLNGGHDGHDVVVYFDYEKGEFVWSIERKYEHSTISDKKVQY